MEKDDKNGEGRNKIKIEDKEGLTVSYSKEELEGHFPHLIKEMTKNKKIKIDGIEYQEEQNQEKKDQELSNLYPKELYNPGVIDFIRRCSKKEEALTILDYLLKRNEINQEDYNIYKNIINQEGGLKLLIEEHGGLKQPGYYMKKYYKKTFKNQKINNKNN